MANQKFELIDAPTRSFVVFIVINIVINAVPNRRRRHHLRRRYRRRRSAMVLNREKEELRLLTILNAFHCASYGDGRDVALC